MSRQIYYDLSRHLNDRIQALINDTAAVSEIADLDRSDVQCLIFSNLAGVAAMCVKRSGGDKSDFLNACSIIFDRVATRGTHEPSDSVQIRPASGPTAKR